MVPDSMPQKNKSVLVLGFLIILFVVITPTTSMLFDYDSIQLFNLQLSIIGLTICFGGLVLTTYLIYLGLKIRRWKRWYIQQSITLNKEFHGIVVAKIKASDKAQQLKKIGKERRDLERKYEQVLGFSNRLIRPTFYLVLGCFMIGSCLMIFKMI